MPMEYGFVYPLRTALVQQQWFLEFQAWWDAELAAADPSTKIIASTDGDLAIQQTQCHRCLRCIVIVYLHMCNKLLLVC